MDSGYYAAVTGLVARSQELDLAATNLANANTTGYRAEQEYFRSVLLGPDGQNSQLGQTVNNFGVLGGERLSMAQGELERTGNPPGSCHPGSWILSGTDAQRPAVHPRWRLSSLSKWIAGY